MQENGDTKSNSSNSKKNNNRAQPNVVWAIAAAGVAGVLVVLLISIFFPNMTERTKFFTANALSVLILDVIIVQAYIYSGQWEAMQDSLELTQKIVAQNERVIEAAQHNTGISERNMVHSQRAYLVVWEPGIAFVGETRYFQLKIKNYGNTPANYVQVFIKAELRETLPNVTDAFNAPGWQECGSIAPGDFIEQTSGVIRPTAEQQKALDNRRWTFDELDLYCWGAVGYEDAFGETHMTEFSLAQSQRSPSRVRPCPKGNHAD